MIRMLSSVLSLALLASATTSFAAEKLTLKEVLNKAIDAHGGKKLLEKFTARKETLKGTIDISGNELTFDMESWVQDPDKMKNVIKIEVMGQEHKVVQLVNGEKVTLINDGTEADVPEKSKDEAITGLRLHRIVSILPLLNEKEFEVKLLEEKGKVDDKEAYVIAVKATADKEGREVKVFFDAKTFLVGKITRRGINALQEEADQEMLLTDYKKIDGIMVSMKSKILHDGKKYIESETSEVKFLEKIEATEFEVVK